MWALLHITLVRDESAGAAVLPGLSSRTSRCARSMERRAGPPRDARHADGSPEPGPAHRPAPPGTGRLPAAQLATGRDVHRRRPLQAGQRLVRARRRRRPAARARPPGSRPSIRPGDTVARLGGDEFVIVCDDVRRTGDRADRGAGGRRVGRAVVDRLARAVRHRQPRHRGLRRRPRHRRPLLRDADAGDVPGEGAWPGPSRAVRRGAPLQGRPPPVDRRRRFATRSSATSSRSTTNRSSTSRRAR